MVIGDQFYKIMYWGSKPKTHTSTLLRTHYLSGQWDTLLTIHAKDSFYINLEPPTLWVNPQGDSVLIIRDRSLRDNQATSHEGRYDLVNLYAWNMRTRQFDWVREDFEDEWDVYYGQPVIEGNRLYLTLRRSICCVDLLTGQTLWKRPTEEFHSNAGLALHDNLILATGNDHGMWGIDKNTGQTIWSNDKVLGGIINLTCFDGIAYGTSTGSGNLYAVNATNGQIIWAEQSPNKKGKTRNTSWGWSGVVIDPERRVLYIADYHYLMGVELPKG
ncbi:MAG: PQQ-binding-like beta-propeller repeat protein [Saprospiraceae bacterium]|nr:PQQ-binding-like beta-propeller repeat protein [Saprospiraceae bacterium]